MALWAAGLVRGGLVLGGSSRDDGDVDVGVGVEGAELVHEAAGAAVGVGFAFVPVGSEVGEPGFGAGEQVPVALCRPSRWAGRWACFRVECFRPRRNPAGPEALVLVSGRGW